MRIDRRFVMIAIPVLVIVLPLGFYIFGTPAGDAGAAGAAFLEYPADRAAGCVRDTEYMRFHHWQLLRRVRDQAVRNGQRGEITLDRCRQCHVSRERFCNQCHRAVSLEPDCFGCHYYPDEPQMVQGAGEIRQAALAPRAPGRGGR